MSRTKTKARELAGLGLCLALSFGCTRDYDQDDDTVAVLALYSPSTGEIPTPNDLLYSQSTDATLNIPVVDPLDFSDPQVALNALDGWSTSAPFTIRFSGPIDMATAVAGSTVRIFEVEVLTSMSAPVGGPVTMVTDELGAADFDLIAAAEDPSGGTLRVLLETPLRSATAHMVVVTNDLRDANGRRVFRDDEFSLAASPNAYDPAHPFFALQPLVDAMLDAAVSQGIPRNDVILAYTFTTQGIGDVLGATFAIANGDEAAVIANLCAQIPNGCTDQSTSPFSTPSLTIDTPAVGTTATFLGAGATAVYVGGLEIPYYSDAASNPSVSMPVIDQSPITAFWLARYPFVPGDTERNLTRFNPLPLARSREIIPVLLTLPPGAAPPDGWPLAIYSHGINRNRTDMLLIADELAAQGVACIAIDLPLHGLPPNSALPTLDALFEGFLNNTRRERTFGLDLVINATGVPGSDGIIDPSGQHFINLRSLLTARDNLRQAVTDHFNLAATIASVDVFTNATGAVGSDGTADFDAANLRFIGHSLGAITGPAFLALEPRVTAATLASPGGGIAKLLEGSATFGPIMQAALAANGVNPGTAEYEAFLFAAQAVVDSADPINYAADLAAKDLPIHALEVVGGPGGGEPDQVVPNAVPDAPLAGTDPFVAALELMQVSMTTSDPAGVRALVRFVEGTHGSLIDPGMTAAEMAANAEMQTETASFASSNGTNLVINDNTVLQ